MIRNVQKLKSLQNIFPLHDEISYCFAYGSAVFDQSIQNGNTVNNTPSPPLPSSKSRMVDLVLAVDDPIRWHRANMSKNWSHYSGLRYFGPKNVANIQRKFAAKIYYNTLVPIESDLFIKYGIISTEDFLNDLLDWETLYLSGRLHKPILVLHENIKSNDEQDFSVRNLYNAIELNRHSALHAALLLLPEKFTEKQLYMTIANLSYSGDFRMWFGEDRSKVEKIVWPQMERFRHIYQPLIQCDRFKNLLRCSEHQPNDLDWNFEQNYSNNSIQWHLNLLPKTVQLYIGQKWLAENTLRKYTRNRWHTRKIVHQFDIEDLMHSVASDLEYRRYVERAIQWIVFRSSATQTIKGFFTAGPTKSIVYSWEKIVKMFKSLPSSSST
ncbi:Phosphatidate cytidylyltransferase, mitochondrial [Dermatophagoides farinae]|uniref:Phosphatidate cytidylyltransferase, mitochondrial n=1 Tax=Dermatophagoides farinae TaxID=6954 RepID=A0A922LAV8_DERFA|nr:phosphatidate cytidylyltransferase, mitochondrial-like [Dermatophagoides farinae]KAH7641330.1 mitochondrial matrix mmp37-like protein [Dermatophagoides farinae]KAH9527097.1 Phosphatidate cytidylyltransferase, mitochondrial [Dermatophagoides farinae]